MPVESLHYSATIQGLYCWQASRQDGEYTTNPRTPSFAIYLVEEKGVFPPEELHVSITDRARCHVPELTVRPLYPDDLIERRVVLDLSDRKVDSTSMLY
jgi:hypothetical protein